MQAWEAERLIVNVESVEKYADAVNVVRSASPGQSTYCPSGSANAGDL
jgi:hypothetical protein